MNWIVFSSDTAVWWWHENKLMHVQGQGKYGTCPKKHKIIPIL